MHPFIAAARRAASVRRVPSAAVAAALPLAACFGPARAGTVARPDHVVILVEENHDADQILGSADAPYLNGLAAQGVLYTNAHGTDHPSQPNYLELFSGANPGQWPGINFPTKLPYSTDPNSPYQNALNVGDDANANVPFGTPNLGASLLRKGLTFTGYSESLPAAGSTVVQDPAGSVRAYVQKHNPWVQWQAKSDNALGPNQLPSTVNQPLTAFPSDFSKLPTVSMVVPNEQDDMHDIVSLQGLREVGSTGVDKNGNPATDATTIRRGDAWARTHLDAYAQWARANNSVLIVTWDENDYDFTNANNIPLLAVGAPNLVGIGTNGTNVSNFDVLRTVEDMYGLTPVGASARVRGLPHDASGALAAGAGATAVPLPPAAYVGMLGLFGLCGAYVARQRKPRAT